MYPHIHTQARYHTHPYSHTPSPFLSPPPCPPLPPSEQAIKEAHNNLFSAIWAASGASSSRVKTPKNRHYTISIQHLQGSRPPQTKLSLPDTDKSSDTDTNNTTDTPISPLSGLRNVTEESAGETPEKRKKRFASPEAFVRAWLQWIADMPGV